MVTLVHGAANINFEAGNITILEATAIAPGLPESFPDSNSSQIRSISGPKIRHREGFATIQPECLR
jgi:hypothetical protein